MAKILKNVLISVLGAFMFMFAGVFIAGCGVDYSKIQIVANVDGGIELSVGESTTITFTIEGYQSGFSNKVEVNGDVNVFSYSEPNYVSDTQFQITVTAVAGGSGTLSVVSVEGQKQCDIEVSVTQLTSSMTTNNQVLYVSESTDFVPNYNMFTFDPNTTVRDLSYFYVELSEINDTDYATFFARYDLVSIDVESGVGYFNDGSAEPIERNIYQFESMTIGEDGALYLVYNGETTEISKDSEIEFMAVYTSSMQAEQGDIIYAHATVYVLADLSATVQGVYLQSDETVTDPSSIVFEDVPEEIVIVPRSTYMSSYLVKVEMSDIDNDFDIVFSLSSSNSNVEINRYYFDDSNEEDGDNKVLYFLISQNSQVNSSTEISLNIYYSLAQNIADENINFSTNFSVSIQIAPTRITVNEMTSPEDLTLYSNALEDYGWEELRIDVLSDCGTDPYIEGVYLVFDSDLIDVMYNNTRISSGTLITDLSMSIYVRGKGTTIDAATIKVYVQSSIANETDWKQLWDGAGYVEINYEIVDAATTIWIDDNYNSDGLYIDYSGGSVEFSNQLYTEFLFKTISVSLVGQTDVVNFTVASEPYTYDESSGRYYLNLTVTPKAVGTGVYKILLDTGASIQITFNCVQVLDAESTSIRLTNEDNGSVRAYSLSATSNSDFENVLTVEIQNVFDGSSTTYGQTAKFVISANYTELTLVRPMGVASVTQSDSTFMLSTIADGYAQMTINVSGYQITNFNYSIETFTIYVNIYSYSIVNEYRLQVGGNYALNTTLYYTTDVSVSVDSSVQYSAYVDNTSAMNFLQIQFSEAGLTQIYENAENYSDGARFEITKAKGYDNFYSQVMNYSTYDKKFIYFYALHDDGSAFTTVTTVTFYVNNVSSKIVTLTFDNGLMFYSDEISFEYVTADEQTVTITVVFSNSFSLAGDYGTFDVDTLTYTNTYTSAYSLILRSMLSQRGVTRRFDANITISQFQPVTNISLLSSVTEINFSNNDLTYSMIVSLYPSTATNIEVAPKVDFVPSTSSSASVALSVTSSVTSLGSGLFLVTLSAESFYQANIDNIMTIEDLLSGTIYIYPSEWGESISVISSEFSPIVISVRYRNGSKANPYLLEDASDLLAINSSETTLQMHYEISSTIDMSSVTNATPIGIIDGAEVGFSGSIVGTSSQSAITNVNITDSNFTYNVYSGLFAIINEGASIENISISGTISLQTEITSQAYVGLLAAQNKGTLTNVGATINGSDDGLTVSGGTLYFGGLVGVNSGTISQDFTKYDGTYVYADGDTNFTGMTSKNLAYFNDFVNIDVSENATVHAGGVAGLSYYVIKRISPKDPDYKMYGYTGYSAYTLIKVTGTTSGNINVGGIVGYVTYLNSGSGNTLSNLLVGGEIDTLGVSFTSGTDSVGGIAGLVDTKNISGIKILANTSRVFLRGNYYVGGIVGYDTYPSGSTGYNEDRLTVFGTENIIQAVDDARGAFYAASIIRTNSTSSSVSEGNYEYYYAIGNYKTSINEREYSGSGATFSSYSYLSRTKIEFSEGEDVASDFTSTDLYYGDYLVIDKSTYVIENAYCFTSASVKIELGDGGLQLVSDSADIYAFLMFYFQVTDDLSGEMGNSAQDNITALNYFTPNSQFYPFSLTSQDVSISASTSGILSVDSNGNITVSGTGSAEITLSSILNVNNSQKIYIYVVNYFDSNISVSIFYDSTSTSGTNISDGSTRIIYGDSYSSIYVVPTYSLQDGEDVNGVSYSISQNGILQYQGVSYYLAKNTQISAESCLQYSTDYFVKYVDLAEETINDLNVTEDENGYAVDNDGNFYVYYNGKYIKVDQNGYVLDESGNFSSVQVNKQTITFFKSSSSATAGDKDIYTLVPVIEVTLSNGETVYYYLSASRISLTLEYQETATALYSKNLKNSLQTNTSFTETISITSSNPEDLLFYEITGPTRLTVQSRIPTVVGMYYIDGKSVDSYEKYINSTTNSDLFDITITRREETNVFDITCSVNKESDAYKNRASESIYGEYIFTFYASELKNGESCYFRVTLDEASIGNITVNNYSSINDVSATDEVIVPMQRGLLEIILDPSDAGFNTFTISNSDINSYAGAGIATLTFAYNTGTDYVLATNFGTYVDGTLTFTYEEMMSFFESLNERGDSDYTYTYNGRIYIAYYLSSSGVDDGIEMAFDVSVTSDSNDDLYETSIYLTTKLTSYIELVIEDKEILGEHYYVARGLSYNLTLDSFGFSTQELQDATISVSSEYVSIQAVAGQVGSYVLTVTSSSIVYDKSSPGYEVTINISAQKTVDGVLQTYRNEMKLYIMEYVLNYSYVDGNYEDIVKGMSNEVISVAIGNPYTLEFDITSFLEYDSSNSTIVAEVNTFLNEMTNNIEWRVHENNQSYLLEQGKTITSDYYLISSFTVTPIRIYDPSSELYYFSAQAYYTMSGGIYSYSSSSTNANQIYTEFSFSVHEQSTQSSPIPIETYEDFLAMEEDSWYILLADIVLPNASDADYEQFTPISTAIAGLDGNGYSIYFSGTYNFDTADVGVFSTVSSDTILQNVTVKLLSNTTFNMSVETFDIGLLACENNGIITNCEVGSVGTASLSVIFSSSVSSSYVAGLVAENTGYITNSRSSISTIYTQVNIAGFVARNSGHIASSYFRGGSLVNETQSRSINTAGFVLTNSGNIYTSYVSGEGTGDENNLYYTGSDNVIRSTGLIAGFVYSNSGGIYDCYSNILLTNSGYYASGFVDENTGRIERCFSTSVLGNDDSSNFGFVRTYEIDEEDDGFYDCYYLSFTKTEDKNTVSVNQNVSNNCSDVLALTDEQFGNIDEYFSNYTVSEGRNINSVWFFNKYSSDSSNFSGKKFNTGRIELVSANIVAFSQREYAGAVTSTDSSTGATYVTYVYNYTSDALGTTYNPILISSAEEFEEYILQECNSAGYNYSYYRFINDIDYSEYLYNSDLYTVKFMGYLEGNFMSLSDIKLISSDASLMYAGLFAEIGNSSNVNAIGTVMNFTYNPSEVNFASADVVGAIAGKLDGGVVYNVYIDNEEGNVVSGKNIVGGAIGLTTGNFSIQNVYSTYSAIARNSVITNDNVYDGSTDYSGKSFAGAIVGVLSGTGTINNCTIDTAVSVIADKAGLMFGLIDENVTVKNVEVFVQSDMMLNGYSYAGFVAGESKGMVSDVTISGDETFSNFKISPYLPDAVGGFAGLMSGGSLTDVSMEQDIVVSTESSDTAVEVLGGIVGEISAPVTLKNITVNATLTGLSVVGGIVGNILNASGGLVTFEDVYVDADLNAIGIKQSLIGIGGIAGYVASSSIIYVTAEQESDESETNKNEIDVNIHAGAYNYGTSATIGIGGVIGFNEAQGTHTVCYTDVTLTAQNYLYNLTYSDTATETLVSGQNADGVGILTLTSSLTSTSTSDSAVGLTGGIGISVNQYVAEKCKYTCNITYNFTYQGSTGMYDALSQLYVNLFGEIATSSEA